MSFGVDRQTRMLWVWTTRRQPHRRGGLSATKGVNGMASSRSGLGSGYWSFAEGASFDRSSGSRGRGIRAACTTVSKRGLLDTTGSVSSAAAGMTGTLRQIKRAHPGHHRLGRSGVRRRCNTIRVTEAPDLCLFWRRSTLGEFGSFECASTDGWPRCRS